MRPLLWTIALANLAGVMGARYESWTLVWLGVGVGLTVTMALLLADSELAA